MNQSIHLTTAELLKKYGHLKIIPKYHKSPTFQEAWDSTSKGSERYGIRLALLEEAGHIL